jgi:hypothetical protein
VFDWNLETFGFARRHLAARVIRGYAARQKRNVCAGWQSTNLNNTYISMLEFSSEAIAKKSPSNQIVRADFTVLPCDRTLLILCNRCTVA